MHIKYWFLLIFLGSIWGSAFMFIKIATPEFGPIFLVNLRLFLAGIFFLPILLQQKYLKQIYGHKLKIFILSLINCSIPFTLFSYASLNSDSNMLSILNSSTALFTLIIAYIWINQPITTKQILGLLLGFIGIVVLVNPINAQTTILSSLACLIAASLYALSGVFIQKHAQSTNKLVLIGWSLIYAALTMLPFSLNYIPETFPSNEAIFSVLWLGIISTGLAFLGYVRLIEKIGAVKTSTVAYFLPVFGILWGNIFLNEQITPLIVIGCFMVLIGIFVANTATKSTS